MPGGSGMGAELVRAARGLVGHTSAAGRARVGRLALLVVATSALGVWAEPAQAAPWCGSVGSADRPAAAGGPSIRVLYAVASDGQDASAERAPAIWADVESIDAWWRTQDPLRAPRFDLAAFPCGAQADLTLLRLRATAAELQPLAARYERIAAGVVASGGDLRATHYLVLYDGPVDDADVCGQGGGGPGVGGGIAAIYLAACDDVSVASTAAHELLHALGLLPAAGPPNACDDDTAHVCDSELDLLYPYASAFGLQELLLDVGHDDYYGHAGTWFDLQDSGWLRRVDAQVRLNVVVSGGGSVRSRVPGVDCAATCSADWDAGTRLILDAVPGPGRRLVGWAGACAGTGACSLALEAPASVSAVFARATYRLVVTVSGRGTVRSTPGGLACRSRCAAAFPSLRPVRLAAAAAQGWRFSRWTGACTTTRRTCVVPMSRATSVRALFLRVR